MATANATRALLKMRWLNHDIYEGTPQQLCAAGLVRPDQFPGQPGMPKVRAMYFLADGLPAAHGSRFELTCTVQRISSARYSVWVDVCEEEAKRRKAFLDEKRNLPLDLPGTAATADLQPPAWAPDGWTLRGRRAREEDYVFVVSAEQLRATGLMEGHPLPVVEDAKRKTVRFLSTRFGWVEVSQRAAGSFFVALNAPSEIRYADYSVSDYGRFVYHKGTKEQLQARGLGAGLGFPGEPGHNRRKVTTVNPTSGGEVRIELLHRSEWCGDVPRFEVRVERSETEQEALKEAARQSDAEKFRLERMKTAPDTPDAYRDDVAQTFWYCVNVTKAKMQEADGYRFAPEVVEEFTDTVTDAYWTIKNGETMGCSPRKKLQQMLCENAKADAPLQRFLREVRSHKGARHD